MKKDCTSPLRPTKADVTRLAAPVQEAGLLSQWASRVVPDSIFQAPTDGTGIESAAISGRKGLQQHVAAKHGISLAEATQLKSIPAKSLLDKEVEAMMQQDRDDALKAGSKHERGPKARNFFQGKVGKPPNFQAYTHGHKKSGDEIFKFGDGRTTLNSIKSQFLWPFNAKDVVDQHHLVHGRIPAHRLVELNAQQAAVEGKVDPAKLAGTTNSAPRTIQQVIFGHGGKGNVLGSATSAAVAKSVRETLPTSGALSRAAKRSHDDPSRLMPSAEQMLSSTQPEIEASVFDQLEDDAAKLDAEDQLERGLDDTRSLAYIASQQDVSMQQLSQTISDESTLLATLMRRASSDAPRGPASQAAHALEHESTDGVDEIEQRGHPRRVEPVPGRLLGAAQYDLLHRKYGKVVSDITEASISDKTDGEAARKGARDLGVGFLGGQAAAINTIKFRLKQAIKEVIAKGAPKLSEKSVRSVLHDFTTTLPLASLYPPQHARAHTKQKPAEQALTRPRAASSIIASLTGTANLMANFNDNGKYAVRVLTGESLVTLVGLLVKLVYWKIIRAEADGTPMGLNADPVLLGSGEVDFLEAEMDSLAAQASAPSIKATSQLSRKGAGVHYDVTAEGRVCAELMLQWKAIQAELLARGGASIPTTRSLCLTALKAAALKLLDTCYPEWFGLERSLKVYWRMYTSDFDPAQTIESNPAALERASLFLQDIGARPAMQREVYARAQYTEDDLRNPNLPLALREAIRLNNLLEFRVPKMTAIDLQTDSFVARLLDPGRFGSVIPKFVADDDGRLQALSLHNLHNPYSAFKQAMFGSPQAPRWRKTQGSSKLSPVSPTRSENSLDNYSSNNSHLETAITSDLRVPVPVEAGQVRMKGPLGSPYRSRPFKYAAREHMKSVHSSSNIESKAHTRSSLGQKLKHRARFLSETSTASDFLPENHQESRRTFDGSAKSSLQTLKATAAIRPLPPPKQITSITRVTNAIVRGALPVPASSDARRSGAIAGQRFHSRNNMVRLHESVIELDTDVCAQASVENISQLVGAAMPMMSPVRASADIRSSKLLKSAARSGINAYKQRMHAGFVSPQAAGVPIMLFSSKQRVALLKGSLQAAASRYAGTSASSSSAKKTANADRFNLLVDLVGGEFDVDLDESDHDQAGAAGEHSEFFEDKVSYASESDEDDDRPKNLYASSSKRYTDDGERMQHGVRDLVEDVQVETQSGGFDPSFGSVDKLRLIDEARKMLQSQMKHQKEKQTWGDYDASQDPVAQHANDKNDWYVEGIGRRTKLVDNPFADETTDRSAESKIDAVAALGIPRKEDLLQASRFGALKASQKDLMVAKVMRKRNPGARRLLKRLAKEMGTK